MTIQKWLISKGKRVLVTCHVPATGNQTCVLLLAGFAQPMCDIDYFMTRLAHTLVKNKYYVMQIDPYGVGDSEGDIENVTLLTLKEDVKVAINYLQEMKFEKIVCISRGIMSLILDNVVYQNQYKCKNIYICPLNINYCQELYKSMCYEPKKVFEDKSENQRNDLCRMRSFLECLGAKQSYVLLQKISIKKWLESIIESKYFLYPYENFEIKIYLGGEIERGEKIMPRNYQWQNQLINDILQYLLQYVGNN